MAEEKKYDPKIDKKRVGDLVGAVEGTQFNSKDSKWKTEAGKIVQRDKERAKRLKKLRQSDGEPARAS